MSRKEEVLHSIDRRGLGIEIGASHNPIAPKREGYQVHAIEEVDFVWSGQRFVELCGKRKHYDWIIASHVIDHTPDLISFLNDCDELLKDEGVLSLVIPDKRYCFDHFRPITGLARIIDSHHGKNTIHTAGTVAEYFLSVVSRSGAIGWSAGSTGAFQLVHSLDDARRGMSSVMNDKAYLDVHAWCFVPHSFRLMIHDLHALGLIELKEVSFFATEGYEFYVTLGRQGAGTKMSRLQMLQAVQSETGETAPVAVEAPQPFAPAPPTLREESGLVASLLHRVSRMLGQNV